VIVQGESMTSMAARSATTPASTHDMTIDNVRREVGDRWEVARITGGYRATIKEPDQTPIPRYGRTPAELLESIRYAEGRA
jgi:hypothetical protein